VQAFPLTDVKAYMGHADIQARMIYVHHVPQADAADKLSRVVAATRTSCRCRFRDTFGTQTPIATTRRTPKVQPIAGLSKWARLVSDTPANRHFRRRGYHRGMPLASMA
jgi:hypothetical protein